MKHIPFQKDFEGWSGTTFSLLQSTGWPVRRAAPGIFVASIFYRVGGKDSQAPAELIQFGGHTENLSCEVKQLAMQASRLPGATWEFCYLVIPELDLRFAWGMDLALRYAKSTAA